MLDFRCRVAITLAMLLLSVDGQTSRDLYPDSAPVAQEACALLHARVQAANPPFQPLYQTRQVHDPDGTGRFYMGREIAQTMGPGGIGWLDRPEREAEERPEVVIEAMGLRSGEVVADLGAGSGYFTFRIAPRVGKAGKVLAVEIQDEMLETIRRRAAALNVTNVEEIKGSETDPKLPASSVDLVLLVDVYHELAYPFEVMSKVREALKPGGRVVIVEYRKEDPRVPIKEVHKMSVDQLEKEMNAVGLRHVRTLECLPSQHIVIFDSRRTSVGLSSRSVINSYGTSTARPPTRPRRNSSSASLASSSERVATWLRTFPAAAIASSSRRSWRVPTALARMQTSLAAIIIGGKQTFSAGKPTASSVPVGRRQLKAIS
jgi:precorrin-6B methylase 2